MNAKALDAFIARKAELDGLLAQLQALSADHLGYDPDTIHWGHVGTLGAITDLVRRAVVENTQ